MTGAALMSLSHVVIKCTLGRRCERQYTSHFLNRQTLCTSPKKKPGMPRKLLPALRIDTFVNVREAKQDRSCSAELRSILCERYPNKRAWGPWNSVEHLRSVCSTSLNPLWIQLYKQIRVGYSCQGLWSPLKWERKGLSSACCSICPADWQLLVKLCINVYNSLRFLVLRQALYCWGLWL